MYGQADKLLGEKLVLYVEGEPRKLDDSIFEVLDKYERPKKIVFIPEFKRTVTGKVIRDQSIVNK